MSAKPTKPGTCYCSFCGKGQAEVAKLVAGPNVMICSECILLCVDILVDEAKKLHQPKQPLVSLA